MRCSCASWRIFNLFITYFAYARQIVTEPGQAHTTEVITSIIKNFPLEQLYIVHPHSFSLHDFLTFTEVRDMDFFCKQAENFDAIAAPDKGAAALGSRSCQDL